MASNGTCRETARFYRRALALLLAGGAPIVIAAPAFAQALPVGPDAQATTPATPDAVQEEPASTDIIVTARKRDELLQDVPVALQAFSGEDVNRYAATSLTQLGEMATQVMLLPTGSGNGASFVVRGISSSNADPGVDSSVTINLDGLQISRGRTIAQAFFDVGSVEVLKGPQVLFFGKNSPAGVISIRSAEPTKDWEFRGKGYYEFNAKEFIGEAIASGPLSGDLGIRLAYQGTFSRGWLKNNAQPQPIQAGLPREPYAYPGATDRWLGGKDAHLARLTLDYSPAGSAFSANLKITGATEDLDASGSIKELVSCSGPKPRARGFVDPDGDCRLNGETSAGAIPREIQQHYRSLEDLDDGGPYNRFKSIMGVLNMSYEAGPITITSVTGVHSYKHFRWDDYDGTVWNFLGGSEDESFRQIDQEIRVLSDFDGQFNFVLGGFFEKTRRDYLQNNKIAPLGPDAATGFTNSATSIAEIDGTSKSLFGQIIWTPTDTIEVAAGVRTSWEKVSGSIGYDYVHAFLVGTFLPVGTYLRPEITDTNTSPEVTVRWKVTPNLTAYAAYKTGYKAGGFSTVAIIAPTAVASDLLYQPEDAKGGEVGLKANVLNGRLQGSLTAYLYDYNDSQEAVFNAITTSYVIRNADSRSKGVDFDVTFQATPELRLRAQLGYNDARYRSYPNAPCWSGQLASEGCVAAPGGGTIQDLSGRTRAFAPKWDGGAGVDFDAPMNDSLKFGASFDVHYTTAYDTQPTLNPFGRQDGFGRINATVRVGDIDDRWEIALIARNLLNQRYIGASVDQPGGTRGDVLGDVIRPQQLGIQTQFKF